jgi:hypothetical protein
MLTFAWTARPDVLWVVPLIGLTVSTPSHPSSSSLLTDLPACYSRRFHHISSRVRLLGRLVSSSSLCYLIRLLTQPQTSYGPYASSALAGQSLCRKSPSALYQGQNVVDVYSRRKHFSYYLPPVHYSNVRSHDVQMGKHPCRADSSRHDSHTLCGCLAALKGLS